MGNLTSAVEEGPHHLPVRRRSSFAQLVGNSFSDEERQTLELHRRSFIRKDQSVDVDAFSALLGSPELPWLGPCLLAVMQRHAEEEGACARAAGGLTSEGFLMGVARGCKERRNATLRVLFDIADGGRPGDSSGASGAGHGGNGGYGGGGNGGNGSNGGSGKLNRAGLCRLFQAAYCFGHAAWGLAPELQRFNANALADNVLRWLAALRGPLTSTQSPNFPGVGQWSVGADAAADYNEGGNGATPETAAAVTAAAAAEAAKAAAGGREAGPRTGADGLTASFTDFTTWVAERAPLLHLCLTTFVQLRLFPETPLPPELPVFCPAEPQGGTALLDGAAEAAFGLSIYTKTPCAFCSADAAAGWAQAVHGHWLRLYSSDEDGLSFNRIAYKILGFGGPTLLLIRDKATGAVFGGFADSPWKESNSFFGTASCFLLRLLPDYELYPCKPASEGRYQFLNLKGFSLPHGLGMGGRVDSFRLFISEGLDGEDCVARAACMTYERGPLLPAERRRFEVDGMEVWGVGGTHSLREAVAAQQRRRAVVDHNIAKARKVDKAKFVDNEFDREMLLGKTFGGGGGGGGGGNVCDQRNGNA